MFWPSERSPSRGSRDSVAECGRRRSRVWLPVHGAWGRASTRFGGRALWIAVEVGVGEVVNVDEGDQLFQPPRLAPSCDGMASGTLATHGATTRKPHFPFGQLRFT